MKLKLLLISLFSKRGEGSQKSQKIDDVFYERPKSLDPSWGSQNVLHPIDQFLIQDELFIFSSRIGPLFIQSQAVDSRHISMKNETTCD